MDQVSRAGTGTVASGVIQKHSRYGQMSKSKRRTFGSRTFAMRVGCQGHGQVSKHLSIFIVSGVRCLKHMGTGVALASCKRMDIYIV